MFTTSNMATMGLYPGQISTLSIANLGTFETEIIITPVIKIPSGGGYAPAGRLVPTHYRVTVRIKYKNKWYEDTQIVDEKEARVIANLKNITFAKNEVMVAVNGVQIHEEKKISVVVNRI